MGEQLAGGNVAVALLANSLDVLTPGTQARSGTAQCARQLRR